MKVTFRVSLFLLKNSLDSLVLTKTDLFSMHIVNSDSLTGAHTLYGCIRPSYLWETACLMMYRSRKIFRIDWLN